MKNNVISSFLNGFSPFFFKRHFLLLADTEATLPTTVERLRVARIAAGDAEALESWLAEAQAVGHDGAAAQALLRRWVPEYRPAADNPATVTVTAPTAKP